MDFEGREQLIIKLKKTNAPNFICVCDCDSCVMAATSQAGRPASAASSHLVALCSLTLSFRAFEIVEFVVYSTVEDLSKCFYSQKLLPALEQNCKQWGKKGGKRLVKLLGRRVGVGVEVCSSLFWYICINQASLCRALFHPHANRHLCLSPFRRVA